MLGDLEPGSVATDGVGWGSGGSCGEYHGLQGASRWFCEIYCGKAVIVGLMKSHIGGKFLLLTNKCRVQKTNFVANEQKY